jgi:hypothetical protein
MKSNLIEKVQKFIDSEAVQREVESDFNDKQYRKFDPSFGDDGCQTRPIVLLPIFNKNLSYTDLSPQEKRYLSLCHILAKYKVIYRDIFRIEYNEVPKPSEIFYQKNKEMRFKLPSPQAKEILDKLKPDLSVYILGEELSRLGIEILRDRAKIYDKDLQSELNQGREVMFGGYKFCQEATTPEVDLLIKESLKNNYPILLKVKRLEFKQELQCFTYLGGNVLLYLPNAEKTKLRPATLEEIGEFNDLPSIAIEAFSIKSSKSSLSNEFLNALNNTESYEEFQQLLVQSNLIEALIYCAAMDDKKKEKPLLTEEYKNKQRQAEEIITYPLNYVSNMTKFRQGFVRTTTAVPFSITHLYVSTYNIEMKSLEGLEPGLSTGIDCAKANASPSFVSKALSSTSSEMSLA